MKRCKYLASDALIAPCAQEGGTFRDPAPVREPVEEEYPLWFVVVCAVALALSVLACVVFGEVPYVW